MNDDNENPENESKPIQNTSESVEKTSTSLSKRLYKIPIYLLFALIIILGELSYLFTSSDFYVDVLKRSDLLSIISEGLNNQTEAELDHAIGRRANLDKLRSSLRKVEDTYHDAKEDYEQINKKEEYDKLIEEKGLLKSYSYSGPADEYQNEDEFKDYKKERLNTLKEEIDRIKFYRKEHKRAIAANRKSYQELEKTYDRINLSFNQKVKEIEKIIGDNEKSLLNQMHLDLKVLSPVLTPVLNEMLVEKEIRPTLAKWFEFYTSFFSLEKKGYKTYDQYSRATLHEPEMKASLWVDTDEEGRMKRQHLFSHVMAKKVEKVSGKLKNSKLFLDLFNLFDSRLVEWFIAKKYLRKIDLSFRGGEIKRKANNYVGLSALSKENEIRNFTLLHMMPVIAIFLMSIVALIFYFKLGRRFLLIFGKLLNRSSLVILPVLLVLYYFSGKIYLWFGGLFLEEEPLEFLAPILQKLVASSLLLPIFSFMILAVLGWFFMNRGKAAN